MYALYYKGNLLSEHSDLLEAEAQARWNYFEFQSMPWEGYEMPPGFMILIKNP